MIVEGGRKYNVRLIPQTCNREDAIREIVGALDHLNAISDEIFTTIKTRLCSHRKQVETLSSRVTVAAEQVSALKGSQKAIRIISPAKYPCEEKGEAGALGGRGAFGPMIFPTLIAKNVSDPPILGHDIEEDEETRCQRPFRFDTPIKHPNDLLSVFHVKEPKLGDLTQLDNVADVGLGRPPPTIRNMDSFFLFNTVDNPYINYKMTERSLQDRNFGTLKPTRKGEEVHGETCPVVSKDEKGTEQKTDVDDFYYSPSALEIPNIDVPESLPDLPGIAESFDLSDDLLTFPSFFPSASTTMPTNPPNISHPITPSSLSFLPEKEDDLIAVHTSTPASAIPPSPPNFEATRVPRVEQTRLPVAPPPPPPPPPPPIAVTEGPSRADARTSAASNSSGGGDLRSSLMAAIREAGGSDKASLKSAKDRKYEAKKKKQDEREKTITNDLEEGGNLMADLKNTLAMRRRGISGIQDAPKRAPGGVGEIMLSLAAAIPTIDNSVESSSGAQGGSDDDDWD